MLTANSPPIPQARWGIDLPGWARNGKVCIFMQPETKFKVRYCTIGFDPTASLDDGDMWPTSFALMKIGRAEEKRITTLVKKAVS